MAQVGVAAGAEHFDTVHAVGVVVAVGNAVFPDGFKEARPSAVAGEFGVGFKQHITTDGAVVCTPDINVPVLSGEGSFRTLLTRHPVEVGR